ncbi:hypothetical protein HA402_001586 [Bradysia odoriphaga]|nr:hypothetical protein HA402_001586 [Bradysia odoriphaga]
MKFLFCVIVLLGTVAATSSAKIPYKVIEVTGNEIEGHSFLRLITPSGKIYHFRDDATFVTERVEAGKDDWKKLPFLTFGPPYGKQHYVQFPANETGFKLFEGTDKSGKSPVEGEIKIRSFAGPNRKRYSVVYFNYPLIQEIRRTEDDIVDYLQIVFEYRSQVYAYTMSQNGDDLYGENCTDSTFLTLAFPNGKVHKIKQSTHTTDEEETVADASSLPYITFFHLNGAKYDIHFPQNGSNTPPTVARDTSRVRDTCAASILDKFTGPDGKEYRFDVRNNEPILTKSSEDVLDKVNVHVYNPTGQSIYYAYTKEGELIALKMTSSAIGVENRPATPFDVKDVELSCIQNCE